MIGVPWRHRGRKPWAVDCIGLVVLSLRAAGIEVQDKTDYGREPWREGLRAGLVSRFGSPVTDWQPGDIALMRWDHRPDPCHVGILGDGKDGSLTLIHAYSLTKVTEHSIDD